ncbi:MAG: GntR family transcriptional regulator/MocR family aminotransferase [Gammaproteobacteria bacterium]|jgi:GntR family transcriptional regulator/MocR family aminotransferase
MQNQQYMMWDRLFQISTDKKVSYQRQLREMIVSAILDDKLPLELALPSSRELARHLGIARNTVVLAYQQLIDEGYLVSRERSGYFIDKTMLNGRVRIKPIEHDQSVKPPDWQKHIKFRPSQQRNIVKPSDWKKYQYPFLFGQLDPELFPVNEWRDCCRQSLSVSDIQDVTPDLIDNDDPLLIEQIQARILPRRGVWASRNDILITMGAQQALYILADLLSNKSSKIGIEEPGYPDARNIFALKSPNLIPLEVDEYGVVPGPAVNQCDFIFLTPSHQSPTTVTLPMDRRKQLLEDAEKHDFLIIEDDYESEINFVGEPTPALKSLDSNDRVIYVGSLSKTLAPGLRLGYMVGSRELIEEARALRRLMVRHPPANNQRIVALFLSMGHHDSLIYRLSETYRERWQVMGDALNQHLPESSRIPSFGGTSFWVQGPENLDSRVLKEDAREQSILIESGDICYLRPDPPQNFFRLGYSSISSKRIEDGIRKLADLIHKMM